MSEAKILYDEYRKKLAVLQSKCKHGKITDWITPLVAPNVAGLPVKYCLICGKEVERGEPE